MFTEDSGGFSIRTRVGTPAQARGLHPARFARGFLPQKSVGRARPLAPNGSTNARQSARASASLQGGQIAALSFRLDRGRRARPALPPPSRPSPHPLPPAPLAHPEGGAAPLQGSFSLWGCFARGPKGARTRHPMPLHCAFKLRSNRLRFKAPPPCGGSAFKRPYLSAGARRMRRKYVSMCLAASPPFPARASLGGLLLPVGSTAAGLRLVAAARARAPIEARGVESINLFVGGACGGATHFPSRPSGASDPRRGLVAPFAPNKGGSSRLPFLPAPCSFVAGCCHSPPRWGRAVAGKARPFLSAAAWCCAPPPRGFPRARPLARFAPRVSVSNARRIPSFFVGWRAENLAPCGRAFLPLTGLRPRGGQPPSLQQKKAPRGAKMPRLPTLHP